jgi:hypothetical protein
MLLCPLRWNMVAEGVGCGWCLGWYCKLFASRGVRWNCNRREQRGQSQFRRQTWPYSWASCFIANVVTRTSGDGERPKRRVPSCACMVLCRWQSQMNCFAINVCPTTVLGHHRLLVDREAREVVRKHGYTVINHRPHRDIRGTPQSTRCHFGYWKNQSSCTSVCGWVGGWPHPPCAVRVRLGGSPTLGLSSTGCRRRRWRGRWRCGTRRRENCANGNPAAWHVSQRQPVKKNQPPTRHVERS